ncbi:MAG TPA: thermopsin family protease [Thermoplasmata archaeon]|nr:thermopsin family protease [Thermoplasmata archaeon]
MNALRAVLVGFAAVFVVALLVVPAGAVVAPPAGIHSVSAPSGALPANSIASRVTSEIRAAHVPESDVFLPNFHPPVTVRSGTVTPTYAQAPAPMGIGDLGVRDVNGTDVGTVSYTSSVEASVTVNQLNSSYVDGYGPDSVSIQLNTVLTHVDVFNNTNNQFWIQNVPVYVESTHKLYIVDNIWNFSSGAFDLTQNSFWSYKGVPVPPVFYYANGPTWTTATPFTVRVYNNATVLNDRPAVFLNYSITLSSGVTVTGSYDRVEFNSTGNARPLHPSPAPTFQIDGKQFGANGYLPNDAEIALIGSSGGGTTSVFDVNATMTLATEANGTHSYAPVPSALDFGFETGETSEGISEWADAGFVAHLAPGPSLLHPLWGMVGAVSGFLPVTFHVAPANAFVFGSTGATFKAGTAAWAPLLANGLGAYQLPPGHYSFEFLLSDHTTRVVHVTAGTTVTVTLTANAAVGIDTPLAAWGNAELANISQPGGAGTVANPYVLLHGGTSSLNPLFGELNDFAFPVFSGIAISHTSAYVTVENAPAFAVNYSLPAAASLVAADGLPTTNSLQQIYLYANHVSVVNDPNVGGWFSSSLSGTFVANLVFWNSSNDLIGNVTFADSSIAIDIYGGSHTVLWGNTIAPTYPTGASAGAVLNDPGNEIGVLLSADHDLVYNNRFDVPYPAVTPTTNMLTFVASSYVDTWNVSSAPAAHVRVVNGFSLSGNILGGAKQGGNYWSTYGTSTNPYGSLPFNAGGWISTGGDYLPLLPFVLHKVTFTETGLPPTTPWSVDLNGTVTSGSGPSITFFDPNGSYGYTIGSVPGYTPTVGSGTVAVHGAPVSVSVTFT